MLRPLIIAALLVAGCVTPADPPTSPGAARGSDCDRNALIQGDVLDAAQAPIPGAYVALHIGEGLHRVVDTDANGYFEFCNFKPGTQQSYLLRVSKPNYQEAEVESKPPRPSTARFFTITLQPA